MAAKIYKKGWSADRALAERLPRIDIRALAFASILMVGLGISAARAEIPEREIAVCAAITGDLQRLECYDEIARLHDLSSPKRESISPKNSGEWRVSSDINPIDDSKTVYLALDAKAGTNRLGETVLLMIRCKSNETELYITWDDYLGDEAYVLTRIGDAKAKVEEWGTSTDNTATFRKQPISFITNMMRADQFIAQVTPYNENPVTAVFDTSGLTNAIKPLRETCNW